MRIVGLIPAYVPHSRVGAWIATHEHLVELVRRGHDVAVRTTSASASDPYCHEGVPVQPQGWEGAAAVEGADVVVSHLGDPTGKAAECARIASAAHVVMVHGHIEYRPDADLAVFNSDASAAGGWADIPSIVCHPHVRREAHATERGERITLVNVSEEKGGRTFCRLAELSPGRRFLAVRGGYGLQVQVTAPNVEIVKRPVEDMREVWSRTRILLMPSIAETWGMVGVEAMCSGIPVIAHPTPGLRESLGDAGIFVDRGDVYGWRREIERLDQPHEYALASQKATQRAEELCDGSGPKLFADTIEERFG